MPWGGFDVRIWDQPLTFDGKSQKKPLEMLKFLVTRHDSMNPDEARASTMRWCRAVASVEAKDPKAHSMSNVAPHAKHAAVDNAVVVTDGPHQPESGPRVVSMHSSLTRWRARQYRRARLTRRA